MPRSPSSDMQHAAMSSSPSYPNAQPYVGVVENTVQALRLVYAARLGMVPRIVRRLNDTERREKIVSGAVFIFDVEESGMRRWTDGRLWSPSRIDGNFLVYRELNEKSGYLKKFDRFEEWMPGDGGRTVVLSNAQEQQGRLYRSPGSSVAENITANGGLKVGGLVKKTITVKINGLDHHLISYYTQQDIDVRRLRRMTTRSDIMGLDLPPHIFRFSDFRVPPKLETGPDGLSNIVCEPETRVPAAFSSEDVVKYPPDHPDRIDGVVSLSHWKSFREPAPSSVVQDQNQMSQTGHTHGESWQEHLNSALHSHSQQAHWSSLTTSSEGQHGYHHPPKTATYSSSSQYQPQGWPSSHGYHGGQYTSPSMTSYTYLPQSRGSGRVWSSDQRLEMREMSDGEGSEARRIGEGEPVWFSAASQDVRQSADSGFPMHGVYPLTYQQGVDNGRPSVGSTFFEIQQPYFARASPSTENPYASI